MNMFQLPLFLLSTALAFASQSRPDNNAHGVHIDAGLQIPLHLPIVRRATSQPRTLHPSDQQIRAMEEGHTQAVPASDPPPRPKLPRRTKGSQDNSPFHPIPNMLCKDARGRFRPLCSAAHVLVPTLALWPAQSTSTAVGLSQMLAYQQHKAGLAAHPLEASRLTRFLHRAGTAPAGRRSPLGEAALRGWIDGHGARTERYHRMLDAIVQGGVPREPWYQAGWSARRFQDRFRGKLERALSAEPELRNADGELRAVDAGRARKANERWNRANGHALPDPHAWVGRQVGIPKPESER